MAFELALCLPRVQLLKTLGVPSASFWVLVQLMLQSSFESVFIFKILYVTFHRRRYYEINGSLLTTRSTRTSLSLSDSVSLSTLLTVICPTENIVPYRQGLLGQNKDWRFDFLFEVIV